jgi:hypothetical protein
MKLKTFQEMKIKLKEFKFLTENLQDGESGVKASLLKLLHQAETILVTI